MPALCRRKQLVHFFPGGKTLTRKANELCVLAATNKLIETITSVRTRAGVFLSFLRDLGYTNPMHPLLAKNHKPLGAFAAIIALAVAIIYFFITPEVPAGTSWLTRSVLVYGHSLCWALLCAAGLLWAVKGKNKWSVRLAYSALATYMLFMATFLFT